MNDKQIDQLNTILNHYGVKAQHKKLTEELMELKWANVEYHLEPTEETYAHFVEELADVTIMIEQMKLSMTAEQQALYYSTIDYKLNRQIGRIEKERKGEKE